jgi:predicted ATPase/transcriptional regulator with XRE-family HTH domain
METRDPRRVGDFVRRHRIAAALSQEELAERAGLSVRAISDLERGIHRMPRLETVRMLADALALSEAGRAELLAVARPTPPGREATVAALASHDLLPPQLTPLIGRDTEVAAIVHLLAQDDVRLVTLTGPGGTGKTRVALAVAADMRDRYADGVSFVDLAPIRDASHVVPTIAGVLGVRENPAEPLRETLSRALVERRILLVLDNCEQVLEAAGDIAALLATCRQVTVLATSREPLRLRPERVLPVPPLALPPARHLPDLAELGQVPSIALFIERAQAADPAFTLSEGNAAAVVAICRRLDGLPLAIELAAVRVRLLPPEALRARLERNLSLLTSGARDAPARQRTLRDTIAWSHDLLSSEEQALLRRLSVFVGGWTVEAAEAVARSQEGLDVLLGLGSLLERSLVQRGDSADDEPRFGLLETIREYGLEQLAGSGEEAQTRERHAAWVLAFVEEADPQLLRADQQTWWRRLEAEQPNIRAALAWFERTGDAERAQRLAGALWTFVWLRGYLREGQAWLQRALAIPGETPGAVRAWVMVGIAGSAWMRGDNDAAWTLTKQALAFSRAADFPLGEAVSLFQLAETTWMQGDLQQALTLGQEAIARLREVGHPGWLAVFLVDLGSIALLTGDDERGAAWSAEGLDLNWALGNRWIIANHLCDLGLVAQRRGDLVAAARHYAESARLLREVGDTWYIAHPLAGLAAVAVAHGRAETAARLLGGAAALREASGTKHWATEQERDEQTVATTLGALGEERYVRALAVGWTLPIDQAMDEVIAMVDDLAGAEASPEG